MRIAFFVNNWYPSGTYFRWHNMALALSSLGHVVDVYSGDYNWKKKYRHEIKDGINYFITPTLPTVKIFDRANDLFSGLRRIISAPKQEYDVYHLFQPFLNAYMPWTFLKKKYPDKVFIYDWDDLWTNGEVVRRKTLKQRYVKKVMAIRESKNPLACDGMTACSTFLAERIKLNIPTKVIGNGFWPGEQPSKIEMRKKWKLDDDIFYMAFIGKTAAEFDWIVDGFDFVKKNSSIKLKLVIAGPPVSLLKSYNEAKIADIIYLGEVSSEKAREIAAAVDLGLIPLANNLFNQSRFPIKFFDFLTMGTPIYLSKVGEISIIGKNISNVFLGPSNKESWINSITGVLENIKANPCNNEIDKVLFDNAWPNLAFEQAAFYQTVLEKKQRHLR